MNMSTDEFYYFDNNNDSNQNNDYDNNNNSNPERNSNLRTFTITKVCLMLICITLILLNSFFAFALPANILNCSSDTTYIFTRSFYSYFFKEVNSRRMLTFISSIFSDFIFLFYLGYWILKGKSYKPILSFLIIIMLKLVFSNLTFFKNGEMNIYEDPDYNYISILENYKNNNNTFFAVDVSFLTIVLFEFRKYKNAFFVYLSLFSLVLLSFTKVVLRANYIVDIISGLILGHYVYIKLSEYFNFIDHSKYSLVKLKSEACFSKEQLYY